MVTYAYRTGARRKSYEQLYVEGKEIARAHNACWDTVPTVIQKTFTADDLPAEFTIDVPTPRGLYSAYPRMLERFVFRFRVSRTMYYDGPETSVEQAKARVTAAWFLLKLVVDKPST